jgi:streptomycin 6-kinase
MLALPDAFVRQVSVTFPGGADWLASLPDLLADCQRRWGLRLGPPFPALSFNYAAPATLPDGTRVVLKAGVPRGEIASEIAALRLYDGQGSVRLLDGDAGRGLLLLERLLPGTMLVELADDEEATAIAARTMRALWRPAPEGHPFPTVADWFVGLRELRDEFGGGTGPFPARLVEEAERLAADLLGSMAAPVVLHGDLHHYNILAAGREPWLAIDPKGVVGEPAYEVGAFMRNPIGFPVTPGARDTLERRLDILSAALGFDRARLRAWAVAQAVLSAWWGYEDGGAAFDPKWVAWAEALAALKE